MAAHILQGLDPKEIPLLQTKLSEFILCAVYDSEIRQKMNFKKNDPMKHIENYQKFLKEQNYEI